MADSIDSVDCFMPQCVGWRVGEQLALRYPDAALWVAVAFAVLVVVALIRAFSK